MGDIDTTVAVNEGVKTKPQEENQAALYRKPRLSQCLNISDFETVARHTMKQTSWNYYSTGADDEFVSLPIDRRLSTKG
jgi:L-lactate dehydrogenase (cytochrome)